MNAIESAAIFCNVPFKAGISADALRAAILANDSLSALPYLDRLLNEAPIELLGQILNEFSGDSRQKVIFNFNVLAKRVGASERIEKWMMCG